MALRLLMYQIVHGSGLRENTDQVTSRRAKQNWRLIEQKEVAETKGFIPAKFPFVLIKADVNGHWLLVEASLPDPYKVGK